MTIRHEVRNNTEATALENTNNSSSGDNRSKIRTIKKNGHRLMRRNYIACVLVSVIMVFLVSGPIEISETLDENIKLMGDIAKEADYAPFTKYVDEFTENEKKFVDATSIGNSDSGILSKAYNTSLNNRQMEFALLEGANNSFLHGSVPSRIILPLGLLFSLFVIIFFHEILQVGVCRFYLELRLNPNTRVSRILFIYKSKKTLASAKIIALKLLRLFLWAFTIVGFPIKYYSYYMIPFIQAENPNITPQEAFRISAGIMRGNKFRVFLFDVSFVGWHFLSFLTFGVLRYFFVSPLISASKAELYMEIRGDEAFDLSAEVERHWLKTDPLVRYSPLNILLMFFTFSFFGWVYEVSIHLIRDGTFVNRGTLYGPWLPIYGFGGLIGLILLKKFIEKPAVVFVLSTVLCGIVEYATATALWEMKHVKYWDYSNYFFNIQGRVCLEGLLVFGIACTTSIYIISPFFNNLLDKIPLGTRKVLATALTAGFLTDFTYSQIHPHTGPGITSTTK
jgi:hypothetical protein